MLKTILEKINFLRIELKNLKPFTTPFLFFLFVDLIKGNIIRSKRKIVYTNKKIVYFGTRTPLKQYNKGISFLQQG